MESSDRFARIVSSAQATNQPCGCRRARRRQLDVLVMVLAPLILAGLLASCQSQEQDMDLSFAALCGLTQEQFESMDEAQVREWLETKYGVTPTQRPMQDQGLMVLDGQAEGKESTTAFLQGGHLSYVIRSVLMGRPTFSQVVAKLGSPATVYRYRALYEQVLYTVGLDYPQFGLSFYAGGLAPSSELQHGGGLAIQLKEATPVDTLECYKPASSTQDALKTMHSAEPRILEIQTKARLPWPGFGAWVPLDVP